LTNHRRVKLAQLKPGEWRKRKPERYPRNR